MIRAPMTGGARLKQNVASAGSGVPQLAHRRARGAVLLQVALRLRRGLVLAPGHFIDYSPTSRVRLRSADDSAGAGAGQCGNHRRYLIKTSCAGYLIAVLDLARPRTLRVTHHTW
jgi:hypothetical protein